MLSCSCDFDQDDYINFYYDPIDFSTLVSSKRKRCISCQKLIDIGTIVVIFDFYRHPYNEIEERCKGEKIRMANRYMCEKCGEHFLNLIALGYCVDIGENMAEALKEYHEITGFIPINKLQQ